MFKFELTYHVMELERKPSDNNKYFIEDELGRVREQSEFQYWGLQNKSKYLNKIVTIEEFYQLVLKGHTWRMGHYPLDKIDRMIKENVDYAQILSLDFDESERTPQEVLDLAESYGFPANFWYYSFSQTIKSGNNFRLVWVLDKPISPIQFGNVIQLMMEKFKSEVPDVSCKDASRLFYGTCRGGGIVSTTPIEIGWAGWLFIADKVEQGKTMQNATRNKNDLSSYHKEINEDIAEVFVGKEWWKELRGFCPSWDMWEQGEHLNYQQQLTLFSGLRKLKPRDKNQNIIDDVWQFYNPEAYVDSGISRQRISHMMRTGTKTPRIVCGKTIAEWLSQERKQIPSVFRSSLEEVEEVFIKDMPRIMEEEGMTYVQVQTAMGKTEQYLRWCLTKDLTQTKIVIAAPTYSLLYELKDRLIRMSPQNEEFIYLPGKSENVSDMDNFYHIHGLSNPKSEKGLDENMMKRRDILKNAVGLEFDESTEQMIGYKVPGIYLLTHAALANLLTLAETDYLIIDENIESNVIYNQVVSIDNLNALRDGMEEDNYPLLDEFIAAMMRTKIGGEVDKKYIKEILKPRVIEDHKVIEKSKFSFSKFRDKQFKRRGCPGLYLMAKKEYKLIKVPDFSGSIVIHGRKPIIDNCIYNGVKVKLFCATPQLTLLKQEYNFKEYHYNLAANKGKIIQYPGITGAKGIEGTENAEKYMKYVESKIGKDIPIITHKAACKLWEDAGFIIMKNDDGEYIHLGNNAGLDFMKGKKIAVVGKLELAPAEYERQWAIYRGSEPMPQMITKKFTLHGIEVLSRMYEDEFLSKLQKEHIGKVITQAVGRARALRESGAVVYVFANFIIPEADEVIL